MIFRRIAYLCAVVVAMSGWIWLLAAGIALIVGF
jgi:hypothetical protein